MQAEEIKQLLEAQFPGSYVEVSGDGNHWDLVVVSDAFDGLTAVKKQQLVYGALNQHIADGSIHAVNMKTYTVAQWDNK